MNPNDLPHSHSPLEISPCEFRILHGSPVWRIKDHEDDCRLSVFLLHFIDLIWFIRAHNQKKSFFSDVFADLWCMGAFLQCVLLELWQLSELLHRTRADILRKRCLHVQEGVGNYENGLFCGIGQLGKTSGGRFQKQCGWGHRWQSPYEDELPATVSLAHPLWSDYRFRDDILHYRHQWKWTGDVRPINSGH